MRYLYLCSLFCLALMAGTCKKDDDTSPSNNVGDSDYIEFQLDDTLKQVVINNSLAISTMVRSNNPSPYLYLNWSDGSKGFHSVQFTEYSTAGITARRYTYAPISAQEYFTFSYTVTPTPSSGFSSDLSHTRGYMEITRLDSLAGGKIEGTFAYDSLYFENSSHVRSAGWHKITEGKFRITRK